MDKVSFWTIRSGFVKRFFFVNEFCTRSFLIIFNKTATLSVIVLYNSYLVFFNCTPVSLNKFVKRNAS